MAAKRDPELDAEAQSWIEAVIDEPFPNDVLYEDALKDGVILCKYVFFSFYFRMFVSLSCRLYITKTYEQTQTGICCQNKRKRKPICSTRKHPVISKCS